ncbi:MAG: hypothetical protein RLY14_1454, partial [Planctomycetota bacterium]
MKLACQRNLLLAIGIIPLLLGGLVATAEEPFRPEAGKFPPLEKAHTYRGEVVFVD